MSTTIQFLLGALQGLSFLFILWLGWQLQVQKTKYKLAKLSWMKASDSFRRIMSYVGDIIDDPGERVGKDYEDFIIAQLNNLSKKADELDRVAELLKESNQDISTGVADAVMSLCISDITRCSSWTIPMEILPNSRAMLLQFFKKVSEKLLVAQERRKARHENPEGWKTRSDLWPIPECQDSVLNHVAKGDPVDVAIYCAFLSWHEEETSLKGYMSVTPALEDIITIMLQGIPDGTDLKKVQFFSVVTDNSTPVLVPIADTICRNCGSPITSHNGPMKGCPGRITYYRS